MPPIFGISLTLIGKIFVLFGLGIYIIFALVVVRQVNLMIATIRVGFESFIRLIAWAHLIFAVVVFLIAFIIL